MIGKVNSRINEFDILGGDDIIKLKGFDLNTRWSRIFEGLSEEHYKTDIIYGKLNEKYINKEKPFLLDDISGTPSDGTNINDRIYLNPILQPEWIVNTARLNTGRCNNKALGSDINCIVVGGSTYMSDDSDRILNIESYNNSVWSISSANLNIGRNSPSAVGTVSNCIVQGGYALINNDIYIDLISLLDNEEEYNSNTWSIKSGKLNYARAIHSAVGNVYSRMVQGGEYMGITSNGTNITESSNNISWYISTNLNISRFWHSATGVVNNCMVQGPGDTTESYNGNTWEINDALIEYKVSQHSATGNTTNIMIQGGDDFTTKLYNGIVWKMGIAFLYNIDYWGRGSSSGTSDKCMIQGGCDMTRNNKGLNFTESYINGIPFDELLMIIYIPEYLNNK